MLADRLNVAPTNEGLASLGFGVRSMGVFASLGAPASGHAVGVLKDRGIDISQHTSHPVVAAAIEAQDEVYALTRSHLDALTLALPPGKADHCQLLDPGGGDIPDPIGGSREHYAQCAQRIAECIEQRAPDWA